MPRPDAAAPDEPHGEPACSARETHISWLFFTPDRVFKMNKPVRMAFLDHSTTARRVRASDLEYELNRRIAPDVYLGQADVVEDGEVVDRMLVLRRLPADRSLGERLALGVVDRVADLRQVARSVAAFHAGLAPIHEAVPLATAAGLATFWRSSVDDLRSAGVIAETEIDAVADLALSYLRHHAHLLDDRRAHGWVRDGHGDLIADDIFMLDDGPRILDCLAFADEYRVGDVLNDIAFLVMDVERLTDERSAADLLRTYCTLTGEHHPASLAHHYIAYRAHVRAKIASLRVIQGDVAQVALAQVHHDQALAHLRRAQPTLMLVGGGPGAGKTTLAHDLSDRLGWITLDSDTLRKDVFGVDYADHDVDRHPDLYAAATTELVYDTLISRGGHLLDRGESVILDATWSSTEFRSRARALADRFAARLVEIECRVDDDTARERIRHRLTRATSASDATDALVGTRRDPWPTAISADTTPPPEQVSAALIERAVLPWLRTVVPSGDDAG